MIYRLNPGCSPSSKRFPSFSEICNLGSIKPTLEAFLLPSGSFSGSSFATAIVATYKGSSVIFSGGRGGEPPSRDVRRLYRL